MRSYAATPGEILVKIRIPNAVPYLFTALRIAAPLAVITAFVAEYFGGTQDGLGSRITSNAANSRNDVMWAYVIGACLLGLTFYLLTIIIETATLRQHVRNETPTSSPTATLATPTGNASISQGRTTS
jgi:NitT/TauT family transport system permease protein